MNNSTLPPTIEPSGNLLAIFPILNFIAFPKTVVPLHIFENRYRQMLIDINDNDSHNMLVLTNLDNEKNIPIDIGVKSKVISQELLPDGRSNIFVQCQERVKIIDYFRPYSDNDYSIGEIQISEEEKISPDDPKWIEFFPSLLSIFKMHFEYSTGKKYANSSITRISSLPIEEIINAMCQISNLSLDIKIQLLKIDNLFSRAIELEKRLKKFLM